MDDWNDMHDDQLRPMSFMASWSCFSSGSMSTPPSFSARSLPDSAVRLRPPFLRHASTITKESAHVGARRTFGEALLGLEAGPAGAALDDGLAFLADAAVQRRPDLGVLQLHLLRRHCYPHPTTSGG